MLPTSMTRAVCAVVLPALLTFVAPALSGSGDHGREHSHSSANQPNASDAPLAQKRATHAHSEEHEAQEVGQLQAGVALIRARQLYLENCGGCHGERGQSSTEAMIDFSEPEAVVRLTRTAVTAALDEGHDGRLAKPLPDADRESIIGYLRNYLMLPAPDADTKIGRAIYSRSCSVCHGDRGDAASWAKNSLYPPPADFTAHGLDKLPREKMIETVTFGSKNTAMMPFAVQLNHEEIAATVDFIRAAFMPEGMGTVGDGHDHGDDQGGQGHTDLPFPAGLVGDPVWGKTFYEANCAECHGEKGNGEGRRAYFMIKKPKDFLSREARSELTRPKLFEGVKEGVTGTTMPAWGKVLSPQEIANVGEYVYRTFLNPDRFATLEGAGKLQWTPVGPEPDGSAKKN